MESLRGRCRVVFAVSQSRKLREVQPSEAQLDNVVMRLTQIFTPDELATMDDKMLVRQVERVWPIAQYVDKSVEG